MASLQLLRDLQSVHDNLRVIERDLSAFPPDLAALDTRLKAIAKRTGELEKALEEGRAQREKLGKDLALAQRLEAHAREALKATTQKVQYTAAVRELDHRERECAAILRPLKELEARLGAQEGELATLRAEEATARGQFDELHQIFLSDHETQVAARLDLTAKRSRLEGEMAAQELARFMKILQQRQGRAVVPVENGICTGCRTKLRIPIMTSLREAKLPQPCESCQRFLYLP